MGSSRRCLVFGLMVACAAAALALGAFTTSAWGYGYRNHGNLTRNAVQCGRGSFHNVRSGPCFQGRRSTTALAGNTPGFGRLTCPRSPGVICNGAVHAADFVITGGGSAFSSTSHCDNADYNIIGASHYPQSRTTAQRALNQCIALFRARMRSALAFARGLVSNGKIPKSNELSLSGCNFSSSVTKEDKNAKCSVINQLGRAMHAAQDFYAHSNWTDVAGGHTVTNPPGLGRAPTDLPIWFNVGSFSNPYAARTYTIPAGLVTGCDDTVAGSENCAGRITHSTLNKDSTSSERGKMTTARHCPPVEVEEEFGEPIPTACASNFTLAFEAAQNQTSRIWTQFRQALRVKYGQRDGNLMVEALTRDIP